MSQPPSWVRQFHTPRRAAAPPVVICPHAGAGASAYQRFSQAFSAEYTVSVLQYPGRQDRLGEPSAMSVRRLAAGALASFADGIGGGPLTVFGHSMGGIVAFEFARAAELVGIPVVRLVISSVVPPSRVADEPPHPTDDDAIIDRLLSLNGTSAEVLADRDVMRMALPTLKADYAAIDAYRCGPDVRIAAPILALGGDADPAVSPADLFGWAAHTTADLAVSLFPGGHFYLHDHVDDVVATVASTAPVAR